MAIVSQLAFALVLATAGAFAYVNFGRIRRYIRMGRSEPRTDKKAERWKLMLRVAIGQSKMVRRRTLAGILHLIVYVGFLVVNIEVLEIILDGLTGEHRILAPLLGPVYDVITVSAEVFLVLVLVSVILFMLRRGVTKVPRLAHPDLKGWPQLDAYIILWTEVVLVAALLTMNASDQLLQARGYPHYEAFGTFPVSQYLVPLFAGLNDGALVVVERVAWWLHILGILAFLNYLPFSKHLHIILAFPNVWYAQLTQKGGFPINETVKKEVALMMDPNGGAAEPPADEPVSLGAKDVNDLTRVNLMAAYTCTECGRCTSVCPANMTGKKLSPRRVMQMTRDRLHDYGQEQDKARKNGEAAASAEANAGKTLHDYISAEELWACTTCNACHDACPVNINPMDIIVQMRQYLVMEESKAPEALNAMFNNVENNQAPWAFPAADRFNWADGLQVKTTETEPAE